MKFSCENLENALRMSYILIFYFFTFCHLPLVECAKTETLGPFVTKLDEIASESKVNLVQCLVYIQWFGEVCNSVSLE